MWFDSHCHLFMCDAPDGAGAIVRDAADADVVSMVVVGIDPPTSAQARDLAHEFGVWASVGVHPNSARGWNEAAAAVEDLLADERVVAVGETGLDFYRDETPRSQQEAAFRAQIDLAKRLDKCLIIHTRESTAAALDVLAGDGPPKRLVFHCWSSTDEDLSRALDLGAFVSFAGNVTFKSAADLRERATAVPLDRLLVETDAPFLAPVPYRGRPNQPAFVAATGALLAEIRGISNEVLAAATTQNARRAFALPAES